MERQTEAQKNEQVFLEEHPHTFDPSTPPANQVIKRLEKEILDIRACLSGDQTSDLWKELQGKLTNLNRQRRMWIFTTNREQLRDKVKMSLDGTHVIDWQEAIPEL